MTANDSNESRTQFRFCPNCAQTLTDKFIDGRQRMVCPDCDFIHYVNPIPAVAVVIYRDAQVLLVQRKFEPKAGDWSLPAGFIEDQETPLTAAIREVKEETGFDVSIGDIVQVGGGCTGNSQSIVLVIYHGEIIGGKLLAGDDASDARFFPLNEMPRNMAFQNHVDAIHLAKRQV